MTMMAFSSIDFRSTPWSWKDVVKRKKHYFFCQVHGSSRWEVDGDTSTVPAGFGVWLPRGTKYSADFSPGDVICALGFVADDHPASTSAAVIAIDGELEQLLTRFSSPFTFQADPDLGRVRIMQAVERLVRAPRALALPTHPAARLVAEQLLLDPGSPRTIGEWATWSHSSTRSLQRSFATDTGISFQQWRSAARMETANRLLRAGQTLPSVVRAVGYNNHSSFTRAFRERFSLLPSAAQSGRSAPLLS